MISSAIPQQRMMLYLLIAGLLPILGVYLSFSYEKNSLNQLENQIEKLESGAFSREKKQALNMATMAHFREADHYYIDKQLETLSFLEPEIESLKKMLSNPNFPEDEAVKKRFDYLSGEENSLVFTEGVVQSTPLFQEVTETLVHPVEVNVDDIKNILCRIEGVPIGNCTLPENRPQLLILDFKIDKKNVSEKNQIFILNLKLLKREFI